MEGADSGPSGEGAGTGTGAGEGPIQGEAVNAEDDEDADQQVRY